MNGSFQILDKCRNWGMKTSYRFISPNFWLTAPRTLQGQLLLSVPGVVSLMLIAREAFGYVKDDAWISFRYARHLAQGEGLVFNLGERLEGYTNFLWTVCMAPVVASGVDPLPFASALGILFTLIALITVVRLVSQCGAPWWAAALSGVVYSAWPAVGIWSVGGLEMGMVQALVALSLWEFSQGLQNGGRRHWILLGLWIALGCLTRPDLHAPGGILMLAALIVRRRAALPSLAVLLSITAPYHLFRLWYFGSLVPTTFLVKGGSGWQFVAEGLEFVTGMLTTAEFWTLMALAALSTALLPFRRRLRHRIPLAMMALIAVVFLIYMVKVGGDELRWYRLFLPAYPGIVILAGVLCALLPPLPSAWWRRAALIILSLMAVFVSIRFIRSARTEALEVATSHSLYYDSTRRNHGDLGKYLTRHSDPGEWVAFQDMGSTPFQSPDLNYIDTVGLVDRFMADLQHRYGVSPLVRRHFRKTPEGRAHLAAMATEARTYFTERNPEWVVFVARLNQERSRPLRRELAETQTLQLIRPFLNSSHYYHGWVAEKAFHSRYQLVRIWYRSASYWLVLFRRQDLMAAPPPEVTPTTEPRFSGPEIQLADGSRILGGEISTTAHVASEMWVDIWFRAKQQGDPHTRVDIRLRTTDTKKTVFSSNHIPGDWLWPAERWREGQLIRDRVLLQLPHKLLPGTYDVEWRLRNAATQTPIRRKNSRQSWTFIGQVDVVNRPLWDFTLVPPIDIAEQRAAIPDEVPALPTRRPPTSARQKGTR